LGKQLGKKRVQSKWMCTPKSRKYHGENQKRAKTTKLTFYKAKIKDKGKKPHKIGGFTGQSNV